MTAIVTELMNTECLRIYNETKSCPLCEKYTFCEDAIIVSSPQINPKTWLRARKDSYKNCDGFFQIKGGKVEPVKLTAEELSSYVRTPLSGPFFRRAAFFYGIHLDKKECCLINQFGPRWGSCFVYELQCDGDEYYSLGKARNIWMI